MIFLLLGEGLHLWHTEVRGFKVSTALTGTRQEVQEKTVYIYLTHRHFGEACVWASGASEASEARVADLLSSTSSAANMH